MPEVAARHRILVVDDEDVLREGLGYTLGMEGYDVVPAADGAAALAALASVEVDLALVDLKMPGMDGVELTRRILREHPGLPVVIMTAYGTVETAVAAMREGAADYLAKPFETSLLLCTVERCLRRQALDSELRLLRRELQDRYGLGNLIGRSPGMQRVYETISRVAATDATVLVQGESGTGKELVARAIHWNSLRKKAPFLSINCGGLTETLLESELFGHEKGSFTGAEATKKGLFEEAGGGTLFLDEVAETTPHFQISLLRALQEGQIKRVGSARPVEVDVRIIAASNRDLEAAVRSGTFRTDLFYRLNVIPIVVPPLRDRREDVPLLATHFLSMYSKTHKRPGLALAGATLERLVAYDWPGNVRELENRMERAVLLAPGSVINPEDFPMGEGGGGPRSAPETLPFNRAKALVIEQFEKRYLVQLLGLSGGNVSKASRVARKERSAFQKLMRRHGVVSESFRPPTDREPDEDEDEER